MSLHLISPGGLFVKKKKKNTKGTFYELEPPGWFPKFPLLEFLEILTRAASIHRSVGVPGRAESYGVIKITDTSRTFHIEKYGF